MGLIAIYVLEKLSCVNRHSTRADSSGYENRLPDALRKVTTTSCNGDALKRFERSEAVERLERLERASVCVRATFSPRKNAL